MPSVPAPPAEPLLPSAQDPLVAGAVTALGGPPGRRARLGERRLMSPVRWLVVLTLLTSALGFWQKAPCRVHDWAQEYQYTRVCYTDVLALYYSEQLNVGDRPYLDEPVEYPVVIGGAMAVVASVTDRVARALPGDRVADAERALAAAEREAQSDPGRIRAAQSELDAALVGARARTFYDLTWVLLTACAVVVVVTTARLAGRRRLWDAALVAVAPGLLVHASTNWDLIAVALAGLGLLAWARRQPVLAGLLLGLGTATKLYPLLFVVPLLALCWRAGRLRAGVATTVTLLVTAGLLTLPVYLVSPSFAEIDGRQVWVAASPLDRFGTQGLAALAPHTTGTAEGRSVEGVNAVYRFVQLNQERPADWDSLHYALQRTRGAVEGPLAGAYDGLASLVVGQPGSPVARLNLSVAIGTVLVLALVVLLAVRAPRRPRLPQLLFLTVFGFLLVNKVWSPQYVLWLLPLAALARPRWGPFLAWQATEVAVLFTRFYYFLSFPQGENDQSSEGLPVQWFLSCVVVRDLALLALAVAVVRDVLRPGRDLVRATGDDDPAGGVLAGRPDRGAAGEDDAGKDHAGDDSTGADEPGADEPGAARPVSA
ncbi:MAG TPA: glycosyltransferase 87 family protein [Mycobacteriales bacterium]|nr:glycosyltransferase 87 family protein [Mycobacteriales bacterium]